MKNRDSRNKKQAEYRKNNKEKIKRTQRQYNIDNKEKIRDRMLRYKFGITLVDYKRMYVAQKGKCLLCEQGFDMLYVDHCHTTGIVRGLLCNQCNIDLGGYERIITRNVVAYLEGLLVPA